MSLEILIQLLMVLSIVGGFGLFLGKLIGRIDAIARDVASIRLSVSDDLAELHDRVEQLERRGRPTS